MRACSVACGCDTVKETGTVEAGTVGKSLTFSQQVVEAPKHRKQSKFERATPRIWILSLGWTYLRSFNARAVLMYTKIQVATSQECSRSINLLFPFRQQPGIQ